MRKKCLAKFADFFSPVGKTSSHENEMRKQLTRVSMVSSRLFVSSMTLLEANALVNNRNSRSGKIDGKRGSWLGEPSDKKLLVEFLLSDIKKSKSAVRKTPTDAVFADDTQESASKGSSSGPSSSEKKRKPKSPNFSRLMYK